MEIAYYVGKFGPVPRNSMSILVGLHHVTRYDL